MADAGRNKISQPAVTPELVASHGINPDEYRKIVEFLGREPNFTELGVFSVMWSEHCSYKSSRVYLKNLPTEGPYVLQGPGENAGVVDIGDGLAVAFKMESHNHPSFIEPYQGAATGVGGILRDIFTMGARPIASLNSLRFGAIDHPRTRYLVAGVVAGIGGYGNCIGVPTVGGECYFDACYNANILVNAFTLGLVDKQRIFYRARPRSWQSSDVRRIQDGPRRHPWGDHGLGVVFRGEGAAPADRAGGRSLHREAVARSLSGTLSIRLHHRHPGHGRGGIDQFFH